MQRDGPPEFPGQFQLSEEHRFLFRVVAILDGMIEPDLADARRRILAKVLRQHVFPLRAAILDVRRMQAERAKHVRAAGREIGHLLPVVFGRPAAHHALNADAVRALEREIQPRHQPFVLQMAVCVEKPHTLFIPPPRAQFQSGEAAAPECGHSLMVATRASSSSHRR